MHIAPLTAYVEQMDGATGRVLDLGETAGDDKLVQLAVKEARRNVKILARIDVRRNLERHVALLEQLPASDDGEGDGYSGGD